MYCRMQGVNTSPAFCENEKATNEEEDQETVPEIIIKNTNKIGKILQLTCYYCNVHFSSFTSHFEVKKLGHFHRLRNKVNLDPVRHRKNNFVIG